ncbi:MAG: TolC family protein, partial [Bacteroidetes bacterium]|nr:TolC family protein [Bacteroidota bacterium]
DVVQAKIWALPYASGELNLLNPQNNRFLDAGKRGQKALAIQQLLYLGHKKQKEVEFARQNIEIAQNQFEQLVRTLLQQLRQSFYTIYFEQQKYESLHTQITNIDTLAAAYQQQVNLGNIPLRDLVRLQSLSLSLKNDLLDIQKNINDQQEQLRIITGINEFIQPVADDLALNQRLSQTTLPGIDSLFNILLQKNTEYLSMQLLVTNNTLFLKWQQSLAIPDLSAGVSYDQRGGAFQNQINVTMGIPIPLWNQNKGNIQRAAIQLDQAKTLQQYKQNELKNALALAIDAWKQQQSQYQQFTGIGDQNLQSVYGGILQNFQKRNVSLLEFTDFMESYSQHTLQTNELKKRIILACETINHLVNEKIL